MKQQLVLIISVYIFLLAESKPLPESNPTPGTESNIRPSSIAKREAIPSPLGRKNFKTFRALRLLYRPDRRYRPLVLPYENYYPPVNYPPVSYKPVIPAPHYHKEVHQDIHHDHKHGYDKPHNEIVHETFHNLHHPHHEYHVHTVQHHHKDDHKSYHKHQHQSHHKHPYGSHHKHSHKHHHKDHQHHHKDHHKFHPISHHKEPHHHVSHKGVHIEHIPHSIKLNSNEHLGVEIPFESFPDIKEHLKHDFKITSKPPTKLLFSTLTDGQKVYYIDGEDEFHKRPLLYGDYAMIVRQPMYREDYPKTRVEGVRNGNDNINDNLEPAGIEGLDEETLKFIIEKTRTLSKSLKSKKKKNNH